MNIATVLSWGGAVFLIVGLALLFEANRSQVRAIAESGTYQDLTGQLRQSGWWTKALALKQSNMAYCAGAAMTFIGIVLQTIGGTLGCR